MFERAKFILAGGLFFRSFRGLRRRGPGVKGKRQRDGVCGRVRRNFGLCALMSQNPVSFTVAQVRTSYVSRVDRRNKNGLPQNFRRRALSLPLRFGHKLMGPGSLGAPPLNLLLKEVRALAAWRRGGRFGPAMRTSHDGKGHHVLVLPGFLASDGSTVMLRRTLGGVYFRSIVWAVGSNLGIRRDIFHRLNRRMEIGRAHV